MDEEYMKSSAILHAMILREIGLVHMEVASVMTDIEMSKSTYDHGVAIYDCGVKLFRELEGKDGSDK